VRTVDNMRNWCGITDQAELEVCFLHLCLAHSDVQTATELFETMIVTEAQRLQAEGKTGLQVLPGVLSLLQAVRVGRPG
jgi:glycerol 3-phosphatase-1